MIKKILLIIAVLTAICGAQILTVEANTTCLPGYSGGTGICTTASGNVGQFLVVSSTDANGYVIWKLAAGSGGGSSTLIYAGQGILVNASGTGYIIVNNGVTSFNGATGTVTYAGGGGVATTTINGGQYAVFNIVGSGAVTSTVSGATTTFSIVPGSFLTAASGTALYYPLSGNPSSFLTSATGVTTFNGSSGAVTGVATNTGNWAGTAQGYTLGSIVTHGSGDYYLSTNPSAFIPLTALSAAGTGLTYNNTTGVFTMASTAFAPSSTVSSQWTTSGTTIYYTGGNVGIGTNTPSSLLTVAGAMTVSTVNGLVLGLGPTNNGANVAVGLGALSSITGGTTGSDTAIGYLALLSNTTGLNNTAIGALALLSNTTSSNSVALGNAAGFNSTIPNAFYVGDVQQSSMANDQNYSLLYGNFANVAGNATAATTTGAFLTVNGGFTANGNATTTGNHHVSGALTLGTPLAASSGGTATTTPLGSNAFSSVAYYPNSNPSGFISTDQYWTGTATNLVAATGRTSLGLGTMATQSVPSAGIVTSNGTTISSTVTPLSAANGGTATTTALGTAAFTASSSYLPSASSTYFPSVATTTVVKYDIAPTTTDQIPFVVSANPLTIKRVLCYQDNSGDTVTFQLVHGSTNVFSTGQTCTAVRSSPLILTSFSSATVAAGETVYLTMSAASSSAVSFQVEY